MAQKRAQIGCENREIDCRMVEICRSIDLMKGMTQQLQDVQSTSYPFTSDNDDNYCLQKNLSPLKIFFITLQKFSGTVEKTQDMMAHSLTIKEDNEKLEEKIGHLEKCVRNCQ